MKLYICSTCQQHFMGKTCEHCVSTQKTSMPKMAGLALILGLGLSACGEKDDSGDDTGEAETEEPASEPDVAALYGVEESE